MCTAVSRSMRHVACTARRECIDDTHLIGLVRTDNASNVDRRSLSMAHRGTTDVALDVAIYGRCDDISKNVGETVYKTPPYF